MRHEKRRLQIIKNDRVIAEQLGSALRETVLQFVLVPDVEPLEDWLVVAFPFLVAPETLEKRIAAFALAAKKNEFRFALGDANQAHEIDLRIVFECALEKLVFPVGPAGDVEDSVRLPTPLDRDNAAVVGHRGLLFLGLAVWPFPLANLNRIKRNAKRRRLDFKLDIHRLASRSKLGVDQRAIWVKQSNLDLVSGKTGRRDSAANRHRRVLECR